MNYILFSNIFSKVIILLKMERSLAGFLFLILIINLILLSSLLETGSSFWLDGKVLLSSVSTLTLREGSWTTGRRSSAVPQLRCVGGTARCKFEPEVVQCYNRGSDGNDVQWECKAEMERNYKFGSLTVSCEGYEYPDDPYILKGSCGLEYTINLTLQGYRNAPWTFWDILFFTVFIALNIFLIILLCRCCIRLCRESQYDTGPAPLQPPNHYVLSDGGGYTRGFMDGNYYGYATSYPHSHYHYYNSSPGYSGGGGSYGGGGTYTSSGYGDTSRR